MNLSADDPLILTVPVTVYAFARNYGAARVMLERAAALDLNAAWTWSRMGWLESYADRPEIAFEHFQKALRLSPLDPMIFNDYVGTGAALHADGGDEEAVAHYERALPERRNAAWMLRNLAPILMGVGRELEAAPLSQN